MLNVRVGFVGFGEVNTPREVIEQKCLQAIDVLHSAGFDITSTAPVRDDPGGQEVQRAIAELSAAKFDLLIACVAGWIPSHVVISVVSEFAHLPILLWGLCGTIVEGRLVTTADQAGTTALRRTMEDLGLNFKYVPSFQDTPPPLEKIAAFARAAAAANQLRQARVGMMGCRDMNLYATLYDGVSLRRQLGVEVEYFEMLEMVQKAEGLDPQAVSEFVGVVQKKWVFEKPAPLEILEKGIRYFLALREKVRQRNYQAISLIDVDGMKKLLQFPPAMVFMLLADELNLCTIPENDTLGAVTQLMSRFTTGQASAYLEFYEFFSDRVLMGVPDYVPAEIVAGPVKVTPTSFGGFAGGLLNISRLKTGAVTICRLASHGDRYTLHLAKGEAVTPRPWEEAGWTPPAPQLPGLEIILEGGMETFAQNVMGQHYILSYGDNTLILRELCRLLKIEVID